jgi:hypothetical protein
MGAGKVSLVLQLAQAMAHLTFTKISRLPNPSSVIRHLSSVIRHS